MITATNNDKRIIIDELCKRVLDNIYLYIDVNIYDLNDECLKVWLKRNNDEMSAILMKYYDTFQVYISEDESDCSEVVALAMNYRPTMISGKENTIQRLSSPLKDLYDESYGLVLEQTYVNLKYYNHVPELAKHDDLVKIAHLICTDKEIGGHYDPKELEIQFMKRMHDNLGRNYIIRIDGEIAAHYATYAEAPGVAVMGGLIVTPQHRGKGFAKILHCHLSNMLIKENRKAFLFCYKEDVLQMYLKLGAKICSRHGKLTLKKGT